MIKWRTETTSIPSLNWPGKVFSQVCTILPGPFLSSVPCSRLFQSSCYKNFCLLGALSAYCYKCSFPSKEDMSFLRYTLNCFVPLSLSIASLLLGMLVPQKHSPPLLVKLKSTVKWKCHFSTSEIPETSLCGHQGVSFTDVLWFVGCAYGVSTCKVNGSMR